MAQSTLRADASALIPEDLLDQVFAPQTEGSIIRQLARRLPNGTTNQKRLPVLQNLPIAYMLNAGEDASDTRRKKTTKTKWQNKYVDYEELVSIMPVPDNVADDVSRNIWDESLPYIQQAIDQIFDQAVIAGVNAPNAWPDDLITGATAVGNIVTEGSLGDLYNDIFIEDGLFNKLEEQGFDVNGVVSALRMKAKLRALREKDGEGNATGLPIFKRSQPTGQDVQQSTNYDLDGVTTYFPKNNAVPLDQARMIAGDWNELVWSVRRDVTVDIFRTGVIQDPDTQEIVYNLLQDDMSAMRVVTRIGWQVPNPVNITEPDEESRYPFAILTGASS